ncbi:hypothetical protein ACFY04_19920 [Streptomyces sp. NPDC001549]
MQYIPVDRFVFDSHHQAKLILLAAPAAVDYYPHVGFTRHECAWTLDRLQ